MKRQDFLNYLDKYLQASMFKDASYNGLQIEGCDEVKRIVTAATASRRAIEQAIEFEADTLLVHHGILWKGSDMRITGFYKKRIELCIKHNLNLIAYHLPLDANLTLGNNRFLADVIGLEDIRHMQEGDPSSIGIKGQLKRNVIAEDLARTYKNTLRNHIQVIGHNLKAELVQPRIAICSGSGSFMLDDYKDIDFDILVTGDVNEQTYHQAVENNVIVIVLGHHASEQDGIRLLGQHMATNFKLQHMHLSYALEQEGMLLL